jgi:DNA topoisomerase-1
MNVCVKVNSYRFYLNGRQILEEGWMHFYKPYVHVEEALLPSLKDSEELRLTPVTREYNFTKPPPRYNPSSLLNKMEKEGIGTKATRADIIETLYSRRYVMDERVEVTDVGINVFEILEKHCPPLISVAFTRELEEKMEQVRSGKEKRENVLIDVVDQLKPLLKEFKQNEKMIGQKLGNAVRRARTQERIIGNCPNCDTGQLMILHSRKTRKRFIGCTSYFEGLCTTSFPLPQRGIAKALGRYCKSCRWPLVHIKMRGRKPWRLCFNPDCPLNEKRGRHFEV